MNWKVGSRGGRRAVPTRAETDVHRAYRLARGPIIVNSQLVNLHLQAIRAGLVGAVGEPPYVRMAQPVGLRCGEDAAPPPCLAERLRLSGECVKCCPEVEATPQAARRSLAKTFWWDGCMPGKAEPFRKTGRQSRKGRGWRRHCILCRGWRRAKPCVAWSQYEQRPQSLALRQPRDAATLS